MRSVQKIVAERVGFEPTEDLHPRRFSRPVPSASSTISPSFLAFGFYHFEAASVKRENNVTILIWLDFKNISVGSRLYQSQG